MIVQFVLLLSLGVCVFAIMVCAARLVRSLKPTMAPDLFHATFLITCVFVVYGAGILLGSVGLFNHLSLIIGSLIAIACFRGSLRFAWNECRTLLRDFWAGLSAKPVLLALVTVPLLLHMMTPMQYGNNPVYHLSNTTYFVKTSTTLTHQSDMMFAPDAYWAYYTRGMELMYAFFHQFPGSRLSILAFKSVLFLAFYFLLKETTGNSHVAATLFTLAWSLDIVQNDVGSYRNDLGLALVILYAVVLLMSDRWPSTYHLPFAIALTLTLAIKGNGLLYAAVLFPVWLYRGRQHLARVTLLTLGIVVPLGLYFYWVNLIQKGSPLYPFGIHLFGMELFPGRPGVLETSIFSNLDRAFPMLFLRGLVRRMGPIVPVLCGIGLLLALGDTLKGWLRGKPGQVSALAWVFLVLWLLLFGMTPLSDRSGPVPHALLYGGQSIRKAMPAVFLAVVLLARVASWLLEGRSRRNQFWFFSIVIISVINLVWFDLLAFVVKPESAFIAQATALRTFDNRILLAFTILIWGAALLGVRRYRGFVLSILGLACALLSYCGYPQSLTYTRGFKRVGQTSQVFRFLEQHNHSRYHVALQSSGNSLFLCVMNGYMSGSADHVTLAEDVSSAETSDLLVVCASDCWESGDVVSGMKYRHSLSFWTSACVPEGFQLVYGDSFYLVYLNTETIDDSAPWTSSASVGP